MFTAWSRPWGTGLLPPLRSGSTVHSACAEGLPREIKSSGPSPTAGLNLSGDKPVNIIEPEMDTTDGGEMHGRASPHFDGRASHPPHLKRLPKSISSFIAGFKSVVNSKIDDYIDTHQLNIPKYHHHNHFFQPNYHDHIIRNNHQYFMIKNYIINNPQNWHNNSMNAFSRQ